MSTIVVTGANGFIGRYLIDHLLKSGEEVLACVHSDASGEYFRRRDIPCVTVDIRRYGDFKRLPGASSRAVGSWR